MLPDLVSLNLSEPGLQELAALLVERGIGIEAGVATPADADALIASSLRPVRVLVEIDDERLEDVLTLPEGAPAPATPHWKSRRSHELASASRPHSFSRVLVPFPTA